MSLLRDTRFNRVYLQQEWAKEGLKFDTTPNIC